MYRYCTSVCSLFLAGLITLLISTSAALSQACADAQISRPGQIAPDGQIINNGTELAAALKKARGGEVFDLVGGDYGKLAIRKKFDAPVVIQSASATQPACFTRLVIREANNIVLRNLYFDYVFKNGDSKFIFPFHMLDSRNVQITNSVFDGGIARNTASEADGFSFGIGLRIRRSSDIQITDNEFRKWWTGSIAAQSVRVTFRGNHIHTIRSDGIDADAVTGLVIEKNYIHDFGGISGSKDHRDMIQIMRVTPSGSSDIVIRNNVFDMGRGKFTQTIWAGGDGKKLGAPNMRHRNVLIENNVIYNGHVHGISIVGAENISVRKNTLIEVPGGHSAPAIKISKGSRSVVIEQNVTNDITGYKNQPDWAVLNNVIVQNKNPARTGFYDREFIYYALGQKNGYNEYGVRPGSDIDRLDAGSTIVKSYPSPR